MNERESCLPLPPPVTPAQNCTLLFSMPPCIQSLDVDENTWTVTCRKYSDAL